VGEAAQHVGQPLLAGARLAGGVVSVITADDDTGRRVVEYAPFSIVAVRAGLEPVFYFGPSRR